MVRKPGPYLQGIITSHHRPPPFSPPRMSSSSSDGRRNVAAMRICACPPASAVAGWPMSSSSGATTGGPEFPIRICTQHRASLGPTSGELASRRCDAATPPPLPFQIPSRSYLLWLVCSFFFPLLPAPPVCVYSLDVPPSGRRLCVVSLRLLGHDGGLVPFHVRCGYLRSQAVCPFVHFFSSFFFLSPSLCKSLFPLQAVNPLQGQSWSYPLPFVTPRWSSSSSSRSPPSASGRAFSTGARFPRSLVREPSRPSDGDTVACFRSPPAVIF